MPTALIADDEDAPRAELLMALRTAWPELVVAVECVNGVDAWDAFLEHGPEVCFLDVRMPGLTGIEVAQRIGRRAHVVFVTAHGDHALGGLGAGAVDFVMKPVDAERLVHELACVKSRLATSGAAPADLQRLLERLVGQVRKPAPLDVFPAGVGNELRLVCVKDVVYFEADGRHTRVVCVAGSDDAPGGGEAVLRAPLKQLIAELDPSAFWQVHRSVIVNRLHIEAGVPADDGNMLLTLRGRSEKLPVSRQFRCLFSGA